MFPLHFPWRYTSACAKPPVPVAQLACKGKKIIDSKYCFEISLRKIKKLVENMGVGNEYARYLQAFC